MANNSYFQFGNDNVMEYRYSHNHQKMNWLGWKKHILHKDNWQKGRTIKELHTTEDIW